METDHSEEAVVNLDDEPEVSETEKEYMVEKIVKRRKRKGKYEYLIKWQGYHKKDNTWEPKEHIYNQELIEQFEMKFLPSHLQEKAKKTLATNSKLKVPNKQNSKSGKILKRTKKVEKGSSSMKHASKLIKGYKKMKAEEKKLNDQSAKIKAILASKKKEKEDADDERNTESNQNNTSNISPVKQNGDIDRSGSASSHSNMSEINNNMNKTGNAKEIVPSSENITEKNDAEQRTASNIEESNAANEQPQYKSKKPENEFDGIIELDEIDEDEVTASIIDKESGNRYKFKLILT